MARTISLNLTANVAGLVAGLRTAQRATTDFARQTQRWVQQNDQHLNTLGGAAGKAGLAAAAGVGLVAKAAMDWESAWTGVLKTVNGTPAELGRVEDGLRGLAKTLPSTHAEIAGVAEAAGQLGVATGDVVGFTKVMIDLGQSTNLSAEEAATSLARFSNVMGTSTQDVGRLGATLVGLGNNYATTESEIMAMSMRLAGAGKQIGLTEGQTMGLSAAMSSVGIEAEAGGSAMSTTMKRIGKAVDEGGSALDTFAKVSGMSASDFAAKWKGDASAGIEAFTVGLGKASASGESANAILTELGITGIREADALLRLSSAGELMGSAMKQGSEEYESGSALIEEATKRYETAESKVKMAWNGIKDAAITAGSTILPIISSLAEGAADVAEWFGKIPVPIQTFVVALSGLAGAGLLAIAGLIMITRKTAELTAAFSAVHGPGGRASRAIGLVSKAMSGAVIVGAALLAGKALIEGISEAARAGYPDLQEYFNLLIAGGGKDVADSLDFGRDRGKGINKSLEKQKEALSAISIEALVAKKALDQVGNVNWFEKNLLVGNGQIGENIENALKLEEAMRGVARAFDMGEVGVAQQGFADMATQLGFTDAEVGKLINNVPELKSALLEIATGEGIKVDPNDELGLVDLALGRIAVSAPEAAGAIAGLGGAGDGAADGLSAAEVSIRGVAMSAEDAEKAVDDFYDMLVAVGAIALSERDALRGLEESFAAAAKAATENGKSLDVTTEKGRANEAALDGIASATLNAIEAQEEQGRSAGDLAATMEKGRQAYIDQAVAMGMPRKEAAALADSLNLIPDEVFMKFESNAEGVSARVSELYAWIKAAPDGKIQIDDNSPEVRATLEKLGFKIKDLPNGQIEVSEKGAKETGDKIDGVASKKRDAKITASAITGAAESALNEAARNRQSTITVHTKTGTNSGQGLVVRPGQVGAHATGGPIHGPGTGTSDSIPALLSNGEHVWTAEEVRRLGGHSRVEGLRELAMRGKLPAFATGGRVGWSQNQGANASQRAAVATEARRGADKELKAAEQRAKAADSAATRASRKAADVPGDKDNKARKAAAKAEARRAADTKKAAAKEVAAAKKEVARLKKAEDQAKATTREAKERTARLSEGTDDLRTDIRRGSIREQVMSGSGLSVVDRMLDASKNTDLSKGQRINMKHEAQYAEVSLKAMEKQAAQLGKAIDKARTKYEMLAGIRDKVADGLRGEQSLTNAVAKVDLKAATAKEKASDKALANLEKAKNIQEGMLAKQESVRSSLFGEQSMGETLGQKDSWGYSKSVTSKSLIQGAGAKLAKIKAFAGKLEKLRSLGASEAILDEVAGLGSDEGGQVADALIAGGKKDISTLNAQYKGIDTWAKKAGKSVADSMYAGGMSGASALVDGANAGMKSLGSGTGKLTSKDLVKDAKGTAQRIKSFAKKLDKLAKRGLSGAVLEEIASLGTEEGGRVADALLAGSDADIKALSDQYRYIDQWSEKAGVNVTKGFYEGGVNAALGIVKGLESQESAVNKAMWDLAKGMEKTLRRAWGIKSPSVVMKGLMHHLGDGGVIGLKDKAPAMAKAMADMVTAPEVSALGFSVPASAEVARYAAQSAAHAPAAAVVIDYDRLAQAMANVQIVSPVHIDKNTAARLVNVGGHQAARLK